MAKQLVILSGLTNKVPYILRDKDITVTENFEQVLAMTKLGEISKLAILICAFNYSRSKTNTCSGKKAAEEIHRVDPDIPILIWQGKESTDINDCGNNETYFDGAATDFLPELKIFFSEL